MPKEQRLTIDQIVAYVQERSDVLWSALQDTERLNGTWTEEHIRAMARWGAVDDIHRFITDEQHHARQTLKK